jgi:hypothetical protein
MSAARVSIRATHGESSLAGAAELAAALEATL